MIGKKFGLLTVLSRGLRPAYWVCLCECGNKKEIYHSSLTGEQTRSCGCLRKKLVSKAKRTHGMSCSDEFRIWQGIIARVTRANHPSFPSYGGAGITISEEWRNSFESFYKDMGPRPTHDHQVDRIDGRGSYCKENCRWATRKEQANNRTSGHYVSYGGERHTIAEWADLFDVPYMTLWARISRYEWPVERALATPNRSCSRSVSMGVK